MFLRSLPVLGLLLLTACVTEEIKEVGEKIGDVSEDIQSGGDDLLNTIIDNGVEIYIAKGNTQCNDDGLTIEETATYLTDAGIGVSESQCGVLEGISYNAVCGGATPDIYIHTINILDIPKAENLGFIDPSILITDKISYTVVDCPSV